MNKAELEKTLALKKEVEQLEKLLHAHEQKVSASVVTGSRHGIPYDKIAFRVVGAVETKKTEDMRSEWLAKYTELKQAITDTEDWIQSLPDSMIRFILRAKYLDGDTIAEIAGRLYYDKRTIERKIKAFFESV